MASITPFRIDVPEDKIARLKQKLAFSDFPSEVTDVEPWSRGPPLADIKRLAHYWEHDFDWRKAEAKLNELPQYTVGVEIEGHGTHQVHFVHQPSTVNNAIPLLFIHGWPGSFVEVTKLLPQLVEGGDSYPAFHVVAPSLIDFGFSSASEKAIVQGGDLGSAVARIQASKYGPSHCKAHHINTAAPAEPTATIHPALQAQTQATPLTDDEKAGLQRTKSFGEKGNAFYRLQSTKPLTLSYSLSSSPTGLLAWLYEKLHDWTDNYPWSDNEILTWVSIYYFSRPGPSASLNIYYENEHRHPRPPVFAAMQTYIPNVPLGISRFPKDLILLPKLWHHTMGPIVFESEHDRGGHFAAWECPDAIVEDLRAMFGEGGGAYGCTGERSGYSAAHSRK